MYWQFLQLLKSSSSLLASALPTLRSMNSTHKRYSQAIGTETGSVTHCGFPVVLYGYESWTIKMAEFWRTNAFELWCWRRLSSLLDSKEIKWVNSKGNQPWIFTRRTDAEVEAPILWQHDANSQLIRKDSNAGKDWRQEEKGATEDEMVGWHQWLHGHDFEQILGDS